MPPVDLFLSDAQVVSEALLHDSEIHANGVDLLLQRDLLCVRTVQRAAQQVAKLRQHGVGAFHVLVHHRRDGI